MLSMPAISQRSTWNPRVPRPTEAVSGKQHIRVLSSGYSTSMAVRSCGARRMVAFSMMAKPAMPSSKLLSEDSSSVVRVTELGKSNSFCLLLVAAYSARNLSLWPSASWICKASNKGVKSTFFPFESARSRGEDQCPEQKHPPATPRCRVHRILRSRRTRVRWRSLA